MRNKYVVTDCFPGCLPDNDPVEFTNRKHAVTYASEQARGYLDDSDAFTQYRKTGSNGDYIVTDGHYFTRRIYVTEVSANVHH